MLGIRVTTAGAGARALITDPEGDWLWQAAERARLPAMVSIPGLLPELGKLANGVELIHTLTRQQPPGWTGYARRVDAQLLAEVAWPADEGPLAYACGPTSFVETVSAALVGLGYPPQRVKTERFGATGAS